MADMQIIQPIMPDAAQLAAAKARCRPGYAKAALARARAEFTHKPTNDATDRPIQSSIGLVDSQGMNLELYALPCISAFTEEDMHVAGGGRNVFDDVLEAGADVDTIMEDIPAPDSKVQEEDDDDAAFHKKEDQKFKSVEEWFKQLTAPTLEETFRYATARRKSDIRKRMLGRRREIQEKEREKQEEAERERQVEDAENALFVAQEPIPQPQPAAPEEALMQLLDFTQTQPKHDGAQSQTATAASASTPTPIPATASLTRKKPQQKNRISADEKRRSLQVGFEQVREKLEKKNKKDGSSSQHNGTNCTGIANPRRKRGPKQNKEAEPDVLGSLRSNVVEEAHASAALPALEAFTARNRQEAFAQMIASIPVENLEEAKGDAANLRKALKSFTHRVTPDGNGKFKMKGLNTSMYHYQARDPPEGVQEVRLTADRDRENSPEEPRGGILGDVMGIGKTLQALVNILDGRPSDPEDPVKTTLLVVPSHLVQHWMDQMKLHCDPAAIGEVVQYHAGCKVKTLDVVKSLQKFAIVLTTYDEVRRSYPIFKPPKELSDEATLWQKWQTQFEERIGPLHKINFQRIVLDEAHMIKNWKSSVSIAVRGLTGQHKWLLSGTPVLNSNDEFYPLFDFLGIPHVARNDRSHFVSYYCSDADGRKRLSNLLRAFMYRRTHCSRLFSLPIINLPDIEETRHNVQFSEVEWVIYLAMVKIFLDEINDAGNAPDFLLAQRKCFLTMLLRLRMCCTHPLMVQRIVKYLLRSGSLMGDLEKIAREDSTDTPSAKIVHWIKTIKKDYTFLVAQRQTGTQQVEEENNLFSNNHNLIAQYQKMMQELHDAKHWVERYDRGVCAKCHNAIPEKTVVTSCMHLYCEECFYQLHEEAEEAQAGSTDSHISSTTKSICAKCTTPIEGAVRCGPNEDIQPESQPTAANRMDIDVDAKEDENDWIEACGARMPSAKLTAIREIVKKWKRRNEDTKVVIFSQFTDFIKILAAMSEEEGWGYRCLTGQTRIGSRNSFLEEFKTDPKVSILIVSLHTGGTGLDMTIAHKCILVDLWWNEAVQNQAFCRLLRHGQLQNVECIKIVVEESIDDYLLDMQERKTNEITSTMGEVTLGKRDTAIELLKLFADVSTDQEGRLYVKPLKRNTNGKLKASLKAAEANHGIE
ncbi:SNF2 family N-terminal domain-containing protein [Aspergillus unguis]